MKKVIFAVSFLFAAQASAFGVVVTDVTQLKVLVAACPVCEGGTEVTTTTFKFELTSCGSLDGQFNISVKSQPLGISGDSVKVVQIQLDPNAVDCAGPTQTRTYELATTELEAGVSYVLDEATYLKTRKPF